MAATKMKLEDWLDDLCVRFINNLPQADLQSMARICFLVEEAHWFYEDFIRPLDPSLPSMNLRNFCLAIFRRCPLLTPFPIQDHVRAFEEFLKYKTSVPVRGAILLDPTMEYALLVKGWKKGANWSFPKGKINMDEDDLDCAIREVAEETGFDVREAGYVPPPEEVKFIEATFRDQQLRLYCFRDIPMETYFEPKTRKEISKIQWYKISDLPTYRKKNNNPQTENDESAGPQQTAKFYMVAPFIGPLKKWVAYQKRRDAYRAGHTNLGPQLPIAEEGLTEDEAGEQPEPQFQTYQTAPPEGLLDNATRELQRLLNMQPTTTTAAAAAQRPVQNYDYNEPGQEKANALLAVLQSGSGQVSPAVQDNSYGQASHHHQNQQSGYGNFPQQQQQQQQPPPPPFHMQPQNMQYGQYGGQQQQPQQQQPHPQAPYPTTPSNYPYQQQPQDPQQGQQQYGQKYNQSQQSPYSYSGPQQQPPQHSQPPIPLLHPQPLPPSVQKGLLARESFATPDMGGSTAARNFASMVGPPPPQQQQQQQQQQKTNNAQRPPLSSHAAALLSTFKSGGTTRPEAGHSAGSNRTWPQQQSPQQHLPHQPPPAQNAQNMQQYGGPNQAHQLYGARPQPGPQQQQQQKYGPAPPSATFTGAPAPPSNGGSGGYGYSGGSAPPMSSAIQAFAPRVAGQPGQPMDSHRTALLDMFKQPQQPQQQQQQQQQQAQPQQPQQIEGMQGPPPSAGRGYGNGMSSGPAMDAVAQANGGPLEMNVNLNLPFGALSLLTRPKGGSEDGSVRRQQSMPIPQAQAQPYGYNSGSRSIGGTPPMTVSDTLRDRRSFIHLNPKSPLQAQQVPEDADPSRRPSIPYGVNIPSPAAEPQGAMGPPGPPGPPGARRPEMTADHKQKLLSLFGKPQLSPTASVSSRGSLEIRSRETTTSSAGGQASESSRRGSSQQAISSADRSFLLGYLASATKP